jgi:xylulokinase
VLLLGIDLGTSSVKVSIVDAASQQTLATATYPEQEADIISLQSGWAEQSPELWWEYVQRAILKCNATGNYSTKDIGAIGIAYQMHGLVLVDKNLDVLRNSIIWCDSRAVDIGNAAFQKIGEERCLSHLLNSPGNFTASKLAWVKENEPEIYNKIYKIMLPGDFIAMKMTGEATTTISALSEGIFWDFKRNTISTDIFDYFDFDLSFVPTVNSLFGAHGYVSDKVAAALSLKTGVPVSYKAGDQPNNALSLNVLEPGEVAATAGTSGVIYGVSAGLTYDLQSRINSFAHVNHTSSLQRTGILLCINGVGIFNKWIKNITGTASYRDVNAEAEKIGIGSDGLIALPFGNGAERMLNNQLVGGHFHNLDFNVHSTGHMARAVQEGIAFSFRYGLDIMRENGVNPSVIRANRANMFLSDVFTETFAGVNNVSVEFYEGDGSFGAAIGAGIGCGAYADSKAASSVRKSVDCIVPQKTEIYEEAYQRWRGKLEREMTKTESTKIEAYTIR